VVSGPPADPPRAALVLLAAGHGTRLGQETNKVLLPLAGRPVFTWALHRAATLPHICAVVLVVRAVDEPSVRATLARELAEQDLTVITGGASRHESEWKAMCALRPSIEAGATDVVVIHDAARPLASVALFREVIGTAQRYGGAIPVIDQPTLVSLQPDSTPVDQRTVIVQTPQAFRAGPLLAAHTAAQGADFVGTDTASCVQRFTDLPLRCVRGEDRNIKITFAEDLLLAERLLARS